MGARFYAGMIRADAGAIAFLAALNLILYRKILRLWWTWDDLATLRVIVDHPLLDPFVDGQVWPQELFTPLLTAFFELDLALFGLDAARFYALHLAVAGAASIALYAAMRSFVAPRAALSAAIVFAAGVPLSAVVAELSVVHYLIAIIFGSLTVIAWHFAMRKDSGLAAAVSALFYLFALLAKEVAAPLPIILLSLPVRDFRSRLRHTVAQFIALACYLLWRRSVMGMLFGGHGFVIEPSEWPRLIGVLPWKLVRLAAGSHVVIGTLLIGAIVITVAAGIRSRRGWAVLLLAAALTVGPYLPRAKDVVRRYAVMPWLLASVAFAVSVNRMGGRRAGTVLLISVPLLTIAANRYEWPREYRQRLRLSDEGRFFVYDMPSGSLMRNPAPTEPHMRDLSWLRTEYLGRPEAGTCFFDDIFLCTNDIRGRTVWQYDERRRTVVDVTSGIQAIASRHCGAIRSAPLSARLWYRSGTLRWDLGPYRDGRYVAVIGNGLQSSEISPRDGLYLMGPVTRVALRIRYDSPQGWTTYSPELDFDFTKQSQLTWSRN